MIIVDRDPRDIYVDLVNNGALIGANQHDPLRIEKFVHWYRKLREQPGDDSTDRMSSQVMRVQFEDLVLNYDSVCQEIIQHTQLNDYARAAQSRFQPKVSQRNIGIWRQYKNQDEIRQIQQALMQQPRFDEVPS